MIEALLLAASLAAAPTPTPPHEVTAIPDEVRERLAAHVLGGATGPRRRLDLLVDFMFGEHGLGLEYDDSVTRTVAETVADRRGNCLSFTLTFVALAREAGLRAYIQEFERALVWFRQDDLIFHTTHVNAGVRLLRDEFTIDFDRSVRVTGRARPKVIDDARALAHYYNNRGAEIMASGDLVTARAWFDEAARHDATYPATWNNLGVLLARVGDGDAAAASYARALHHDPQHTSALSNLALLHRDAGGIEAAEAYERRIEAIQSHDPFHFFVRGLKHEMRGEYAAARDQFRRAIRMHPGEHEFHFALARAAFMLGDERGAGRALDRARSMAPDVPTQHRYETKLAALRAPARVGRETAPRPRVGVRECLQSLGNLLC
jgi:Tfp pilus assembly protein PilF